MTSSSSSSRQLPDRGEERQGPTRVHAALAYYFANKKEVDAEVAADGADAERIESEFFNRQPVA